MKCQYCKTIFSNKQNLNYHQIKAKYCLKRQGIKPVGDFKCNICEK